MCGFALKAPRCTVLYTVLFDYASAVTSGEGDFRPFERGASSATNRATPHRQRAESTASKKCLQSSAKTCALESIARLWSVSTAYSNQEYSTQNVGILIVFVYSSARRMAATSLCKSVLSTFSASRISSAALGLSEWRTPLVAVRTSRRHSPTRLTWETNSSLKLRK